MWIWFDENGTLQQQLTHGNPARVGSTSFEIFAYFNNISLEEFTLATIRFEKPDLTKTEYPTLFMKSETKTFVKTEADGSSPRFVNGQEYPGYSFNFHNFLAGEDVVALLDTPGLWYATINLVNSTGTRNVTGIISFNVQSAVSVTDEGETELTLDNLVDNIASVMSEYQKSYSPNNMRGYATYEDAENELPLLGEGQYVYAGRAFYRKNGDELVAVCPLFPAGFDLSKGEFYVNGYIFELPENKQGTLALEEEIPGVQATATIVLGPLTNLNGRRLTAYEEDWEHVGEYHRVHITRYGNELTEEQAKDYMEFMSGSRFLPVYNYEKPQNSIWISLDPLLQVIVFFKPQYENGAMYLYRIPNPFAYQLQIDEINNELANKLDKDTSTGTQRAYVINSDGTQGTRSIYNEPYPNAIPQYDSNARLQTEAPANNKDATNKNYVDTGLSAKLDKVTSTGTQRAYIVNADGTQGTRSIYNEPFPLGIAQYTSDGRLQTETPVNNKDAVNKQYLESAIATVKSNSFQVVASLPSTGQEGIIYLVETSSGSGVYNQYIWEGNAWLDLGTTQIDLSNYPTKNGNETITGEWTFNSGFRTEYIKDTSGNNRFRITAGIVYCYANYVPDTNNTRDLGSSSNKWKDLYLNGTLYGTTYNYTIDNSYKILYGLQVSSSSIGEIKHEGYNYFAIASTGTFTLQAAPTGCNPEYHGYIQNMGTSTITLTFTGVSNIICNDDNMVVSSNTITIVGSAKFEFSICAGRMVAINFEAN